MSFVSRMLGIDLMVNSQQEVMKEVLRTAQMQSEALARMTSLMERMSETWIPSGLPELRDDEDYRLKQEETENG